MMQRVLQRFGRPSAMFGNPFAAHPQLVRNQFRGCTWVYCGVFATNFGVFATHLRNVCNVFVFCMLHIRITKVWFLTCKKGVFELQKYGFCFLNVALLQSVRHVFAICSPHCCNPFATYSPNVRHVFAICSPRIRNL